nr:hypothetical protein [uncultured Psychroserpens sp.]
MRYLKKYILPVIVTLFYFHGNGQIPDSIPSVVLDFYGSSEYSNKINDKAPVETLQFGQLSGIWYCSGFMPDPLGKVDKVSFKAFWAWKYILDGYGVQDFFYQGKNEFLYWDYFKRDASLTQLRVFNTSKKIWEVAFITNRGGEIPGNVFGIFTAKEHAGELIMEPSQKNSDKLTRIVFYDFTETSFEWRAEISTDSGKSWTVTTRLSGKRMQ